MKLNHAIYLEIEATNTYKLGHGSLFVKLARATSPKATYYFWSIKKLENTKSSFKGVMHEIDPIRDYIN